MIRPRAEMDDMQLRPAAVLFLLQSRIHSRQRRSCFGKSKTKEKIDSLAFPSPRFTLMLCVDCRKNDGGKWKPSAPRVSLELDWTPNSSRAGEARGARFYDPPVLARPQINRQPWQINCQISDACLPASLPRLFPRWLYNAAWGLLIDGSGGDFVTGGGYAGIPNEWQIRRSVASPVPLRIRRSERPKYYLR